MFDLDFWRGMAEAGMDNGIEVFACIPLTYQASSLDSVQVLEMGPAVTMSSSANLDMQSLGSYDAVNKPDGEPSVMDELQGLRDDAGGRARLAVIQPPGSNYDTSVLVPGVGQLLDKHHPPFPPYHRTATP